MVDNFSLRIFSLFQALFYGSLSFFFAFSIMDGLWSGWMEWVFLFFLFFLPWIVSILGEWKKGFVGEKDLQVNVPLNPRSETGSRLTGTIKYLWPLSGHAIVFNLVTLLQLSVFAFVLSYPLAMFLSEPTDLLLPLFVIGLAGVRLGLKIKKEEFLAGFRYGFAILIGFFAGGLILLSAYFTFSGVPLEALFNPSEVYEGIIKEVIEWVWAAALCLTALDAFSSVGFKRV